MVVLNFAVNYLAVVAGAIAGGVIGAVYYGALGFADRGSRMTTGPRQSRPGPRQMALGFVVGLVTPGSSRSSRSTCTHHRSAMRSCWECSFGSGSPTFKTAQVAFEGRPWGLWTIQAVHDVLVEVVLAIIVTLWR